ARRSPCRPCLRGARGGRWSIGKYPWGGDCISPRAEGFQEAFRVVGSDDQARLSEIHEHGVPQVARVQIELAKPVRLDPPGAGRDTPRGREGLEMGDFVLRQASPLRSGG